MKVGNHQALILVSLLLLILIPSHVDGIVEGDENTPPISKYKSYQPIIISDESDFITYGFSGEGTSEDPYVLEDVNITTSFSTCIWIEEIEDFFIIRNSVFRTDSQSSAIYLDRCQNGQITNCWVEDARVGIDLRWCEKIEVIENTIVSGVEGISSHGFNNSFLQNILVDNSIGFDMHGDNSTISGNRIYANERRGLDLDVGSYYNTITDNVLGWNEGELILTGGLDAFDDGVGNSWEGNYYSDYSGMGDYEIEGYGNATDDSPHLLSDGTPPSLSTTDPITLSAGNPALNISFLEEYPVTYEIQLDATTISEGYYFGGNTIVLLDHLPVGTYDVTVWAIDGAGNTGSSIITVEIVLEIDLQQLTFVSVGITAIISIIAILEVIRRRK